MSYKVLALVLLVLAVDSLGSKISELDIIADAHWTRAINERLCQEGTHSDQVAAAFYACYDDVVGAAQYKSCQEKVYGAPMNTQAEIDHVCTSDKFPQYATCLFSNFGLHGVNPLDAVHQLAPCQAAVLGVPRP